MLAARYAPRHMRRYRFQIVNVFAETTFGGNPLAVFEDARGLSDAELQAVADQLNLSETTFVFPSDRHAARVRIFSPGYEMAFAGHPTLGTSHVVRGLGLGGDAFALELNVGPIDVRAKGDVWELSAGAPRWSEPVTPPPLGLDAAQVLPGARWVSTGIEQLLVPLRDAAAVDAARPTSPLPRRAGAQVGLYVFAPVAGGFRSRFFWEQHGELREDPGTGSACANLGGWLLAEGRAVPLEARIEQGHAVGRLNVLSLRVDATGHIHVGGRVVPLMTGELTLR